MCINFGILVVFIAHRRESFPQTHHPLRPLHSSRSSRKKHGKHGGTAAQLDTSKTSADSSDVGSPLRLQSSESDTRLQQQEEPGSPSSEVHGEVDEDDLAEQEEESSPLIQ